MPIKSTLQSTVPIYIVSWYDEKKKLTTVKYKIEIKINITFNCKKRRPSDRPMELAIENECFENLQQ